MTYYSKDEFFELDESEKAEYYDRLKLQRKEAVTANQKEELADAFGEISGYYNSEEFSSDLKTEAFNQRNSDTGYKMDKKKKIVIFALIGIVVAVIVAAVIMVSSVSGSKKNKYENAITLYEAGKFDEAREIFSALGDYQQSKLYIVAIDSEKKANTFGGEIIRVGELVRFGKYDQDGDPSEEEDIEWLVLDVVIDEEKGTKKALLIADNVIDAKNYGGDEWKSSSVRTFLNEDFFDDAFIGSEQDKIVNTLYAEYEDEKETVLLYECSDYVTLPSVSDMGKYLPDATSASSDVSVTAESVSEYNETGAYLLRSYTAEGKPLFVTDKGAVSEEGAESTDILGIKPMIWVKLDGSK